MPLTHLYFWDSCTRSIPETKAIICGDKAFTYREADERANALSYALFDKGVERGDKVAIGTYNGNEFIETAYAAWKLGAVPFNLNYRFVERELEYVIDDSDATAVVLHEDIGKKISAIKKNLKKVNVFVVIGKDIPKGMFNYEELISRYPRQKPKVWKPVGDDDWGYQYYTGGTTGYPKGVLYKNKHTMGGLFTSVKMALTLSLDSLNSAPKDLYDSISGLVPIPGVGTILNSSISRRLMTNSLTEKLLSGVIDLGITFPSVSSRLVPRLLGGRFNCIMAAPMIHFQGWGSSFGFTSMGGTLICPKAKRFDADEVWKLAEKWKAVAIVAVGGTMMKMLADAVDSNNYDLSSLFLIYVAGDVTPGRVKKTLHKNIPQLMIVDGFGSTESMINTAFASTSAMEEIGDAVFKVYKDANVFNERGETVKPGEVGELGLRVGHSYSSEYYKKPEKSKKTYRMINGEKWAFIGDFATVDEVGQIHFLGRTDDTVLTGGEKVYSTEVEEIIKEHPKVNEVVIVGVPDERWGQAVTALIQPKKEEKISSDEIIDFCRDKMAGFKRPKHVIFVDEVPLTTIGKINHKKARELAKDVLGIKD